MPELISTREGLRARSAALWLDAHRPTACSFVSHAHGDHIARHGQTIATAPTLALLSARLGRPTAGLPVPYRRPFALGPLTLELFPAGHILGSAQLRLTDRDGHRTLFTGDLNTARGRTAEPLEVVACDTLVMEATFGTPGHLLPPRERVEDELCSFVAQTLDANQTPVLLAYPLGKAQEAAHLLAERGFRVRLHGSAARFLPAYAAAGFAFPGVTLLKGAPAPGDVLIVPPALRGSRRLARLPARSCALTGWAAAGGPPRWGAEHAIPLSDHADFDGLCSYARATGATEILTLHGAAGALASALVAEGLFARPLQPATQLSLALGGGPNPAP